MEKLQDSFPLFLHLRIKTDFGAPEMPETLHQPTNVFRNATSLIQEELGRLEGVRRAIKAGAKVAGLPTGYQSLDDRFNGLNAEKLYFLGGYPGSGKTSLALNISMNVAQYGYPVVYVTSDEGARRLALKMACVASDVRLSDLNRGGDPTNLETYISTNPRAINNISIIENGRVGMGELGVKMSEMLRDAVIPDGFVRQGLLVIDYLQVMASAQASGGEDAKYKNSANIVESFINNLRMTLSETRFACLCLSALSRGKDGANYANPDMSSFRDSSSIEFSADVAMALFEDTKPLSLITSPYLARKLRIFKNRDGDTGHAISMILNGPTGKMDDT